MNFKSMTERSQEFYKLMMGKIYTNPNVIFNDTFSDRLNLQ